MITGKGRCNVTNDTDIQGFLENVPRNPRFLYAALNTFTPQDTINFFESLGVELKTERGKRVYPESDKAKDIVDAMRKYAEGCTVLYHKVTAIKKLDDGKFLIDIPEKMEIDQSIDVEEMFK